MKKKFTPEQLSGFKLGKQIRKWVYTSKCTLNIYQEKILLSIINIYDQINWGQQEIEYSINYKDLKIGRRKFYDSFNELIEMNFIIRTVSGFSINEKKKQTSKYKLHQSLITKFDTITRGDMVDTTTITRGVTVPLPEGSPIDISSSAKAKEEDIVREISSPALGRDSSLQEEIDVNLKQPITSPLNLLLEPLFDRVITNYNKNPFILLSDHYRILIPIITAIELTSMLKEKIIKETSDNICIIKDQKVFSNLFLNKLQEAITAYKTLDNQQEYLTPVNTSITL